MKDYRLSEIKNHDWRENWDVSDDISKGYREYEFLRELQLDLGIYDIEPRDMIELPYKDYVFDEEEQSDNWFVYYRNTEFRCVDCRFFDTEADADAFVNELLQKAQQLKGGKQ